MKKTLLLAISSLTLLIATLSLFANTSPHSIDSIVAIVNDDVITQSELKQGLIRAKAEIQKAHLEVPQAASLEKQVLEQLINKSLQLQLAKAAGIQISKEEIDHIINKIALQNNMKVTELYRQIEKEGVNKNNYRQEIADQVTIQKLQQQEVASKLTITPDELNTFIKSEAWLQNGNKEYRLEDILIPLADNPATNDINKAKEKANQLLIELEHGKSFHHLAQTESKNAKALSGYDLGWRKLPEIPSAFTEHVIHMRKKQISGPIQTPNGFHIIRLANVRVIKSAHEQPQRKQIEELLFQQKLEEAIQNWIAKLKTQAYISYPNVIA